MTELEKVERAKMYMDKLANGIDPVSDTELPDDGALNNVRLSRCFFYVSDILRQVIENGGTVKPVKRERSNKKPTFYLAEEKRRAFAFSAAVSYLELRESKTPQSTRNSPRSFFRLLIRALSSTTLKAEKDQAQCCAADRNSA